MANKADVITPKSSAVFFLLLCVATADSDFYLTNRDVLATCNNLNQVNGDIIIETYIVIEWNTIF